MDFDFDDEIGIGALVEAEKDGELLHYLLAPAGGGLVLLLVQLDLEVGAVLAQEVKHLGEHLDRHALERPDRDGPHLPGQVEVEVRLGRRQPIQDRFGVGEQPPAEGGDLDRPGTAAPPASPSATPSPTSRPASPA